MLSVEKANYGNEEIYDCVITLQKENEILDEERQKIGIRKLQLEAYDKEGILVMDEMCDMWNTHKNNNDFALHFETSYEEIARAMVQKDYNHPCVILYSTGNEIPEMGTERKSTVKSVIC